MISKWEFKPTAIEGLFEVNAFNASDVRGCLTKDYSKEVFEANGIYHDLAEVFYTTSHKGVIRALHFQRVMQQPKLVRCIWGHVWDVVVDLRKNSPTFKKWLAFDLIGEKHNEILVPAGCAHGYLVLKHSIVSYKCAEKFFGEYDDGIRWDDADIGVAWPLHLIGGRENVILAEKDENLQSFAEFMQKYGGFSLPEKKAENREELEQSGDRDCGSGRLHWAASDTAPDTTGGGYSICDLFAGTPSSGRTKAARRICA